MLVWLNGLIHFLALVALSDRIGSDRIGSDRLGSARFSFDWPRAPPFCFVAVRRNVGRQYLYFCSRAPIGGYLVHWPRAPPPPPPPPLPCPVLPSLPRRPDAALADGLSAARLFTPRSRSHVLAKKQKKDVVELESNFLSLICISVGAVIDYRSSY